LISVRAGWRLFWCVGLALALSTVPAAAQSTDPIKIGVIGEESSVAGASLTKAAVVAIQWQSGKQVCVWPTDKCKAKVTFPSFVKTLN
jgi:hypothetical protein